MSPFACFRQSKNTMSVAFLVVATFAVAFGATGCVKLKARDLLNKGVVAYTDGKYDQAIEDFKQAKDLDPTLMNARLYLATAYATQYVPGAPSDREHPHGRAGRQGIPGCSYGGSEQYLRDRRHRFDSVQHGRHAVHTGPGSRNRRPIT